MQEAELKIEQVAIEELKPAEYNPRKWTEAARRGLTDSLDEFGFVQPIVVNSAPARKGVIVGGNFKLDIARSKGMKTVPVVWVNLTLEREKELNLRLNKNQGEFDLDLLAGFDPELLKDVGFDSRELDKIFDEDSNDEFDAEKEAAAIVTPNSKLGDLYELGRHRLLCGDATSREDVQKLLGGGALKADMVFTDPPYNVDYTGKTANALKIENDKKEDGAFAAFLNDSLKNMANALRQGGAAYVCHADTERVNFTNAFTNAGFYFSSVIIWAKNNATFGRQDYFWKHEAILYGWKEGAGHNFYGNAKHTTMWDHEPTEAEMLEEMKKIVTKDESGEGTVWRVDRPAKNTEHPTMKPVKLVSIAIRNSSKRDDIVLDLFGGSGSTLIAAEQLNRTAYLMELDPRYIDVIIKRYEKLTGETAKKL